MKSQSRKAKGRELQKKIAEFLTNLFSWKEGDCESRPMGSGGVDLMMSPKARDDFPFSIESKNWKKFPSAPALEQADYNKYKGTIGCVVWKPPRKSAENSIIYFNLKEFAEFWKEYNEKANKT